MCVSKSADVCVKFNLLFPEFWFDSLCKAKKVLLSIFKEGVLVLEIPEFRSCNVLNFETLKKTLEFKILANENHLKL